MQTLYHLSHQGSPKNRGSTIKSNMLNMIHHMQNENDAQKNVWKGTLQNINGGNTKVVGFHTIFTLFFIFFCNVWYFYNKHVFLVKSWQYNKGHTSGWEKQPLHSHLSPKKSSFELSFRVILWGYILYLASLTRWTCVWTTLGVGDGQGSLACCSPWGHKQSEWLSNGTDGGVSEFERLQPLSISS